jgi:hypothetical protein
LPTSQPSFYLSNNIIPNELGLKRSPNGSPRYFIGREETPQPKTPASSSRLSTAPTGTSTDLAKLSSNLKLFSLKPIAKFQQRIDGVDVIFSGSYCE